MKKLLSLFTVLALTCAGLHAQSTNSAPSTNIVVTVMTPPAMPTIHEIRIPASVFPGFRAALLPQLDPQAVNVSGKSATSISLHKNADGSWSGQIIFQ